MFYLVLDSLGKSNSLVAHIEFGVIFSNEYISKDPPRSHWKFQTSDARDTLSNTKLCDLKNIIFSTKFVLLTANCECQKWQGINEVAINGILPIGNGLKNETNKCQETVQNKEKVCEKQKLRHSTTIIVTNKTFYSLEKIAIVAIW